MIYSTKQGVKNDLHFIAMTRQSDDSNALLNKDFATLWLYSNCSETDLNSNQEYIMTHHPEIIQGSRHGDMLENTNISGYRSEGVYMVSKTPESGFKVIDLDYDYDDYGGPSHEFSVITDFPLDYWHYDHMNVRGGEVQSYWHCGDHEQYMYFDGNKLRKGAQNIKCTESGPIFEYNGIWYSIRGDSDLSFEAFCERECIRSFESTEAIL